MNVRFHFYHTLKNLFEIRGAIFSNILNMFSTLVFQVVLTSSLGVSDDLGRFYLFITITVIVTSVATSAFQNVYLGSLVRDETVRVDVVRKFFWIACVTFFVQQIFTAVYFFVSTNFYDKQESSIGGITLLLLSALYSLFQLSATVLIHILIALKKYKSASYLPIIPSMIAAFSVAYSPSFLVAICSLTIGSALQILFSVFLIKSVPLDLANYSVSQLHLPPLSVFLFTTLQYVLISSASVMQRSLMASNSLAAFSLFSVAERNVLTESTLATRGFNQVTIAEVMRIKNTTRMQANKLLELLRTLCVILILMSVSFYLLAPPLMSFIYIRGQFSVANLQECVELMKVMQAYICVEALIVLYSNFLFNIRKFKPAIFFSCLSSATLIVSLLWNRHSLTPYVAIQILTWNSSFWLIVRFVYINRLLELRSREIITMIILLFLSLCIPTLGLLHFFIV